MRTKTIVMIMILLSLGSTFVIMIPMAFSPAGDPIIIVAPSGDTTGVTDADSIEWALTNVAPGGTVELSAGRFYISRSILIDDFSGTLKGTGKEITIIEAVRESEASGDGFSPASRGPPLPFTAPVMLWFFKPVNILEIRDLTLQVLHPNPCDQYNFYGIITTAINSGIYIERGGLCETIISSVQVKGADGDFRGKNIFYGIIRYGFFPYGTQFQDDIEGDTIFEDCDVENCGGIALEYFGYDDSAVNIQNNIITDCGGPGIFFASAPRCTATISDNEINNAYAFGGMKIVGCSVGNILIEENTIKKFEAYQPDETPIRVQFSENVRITDNTFIDIYNKKAHVDAAIYLRQSTSNCFIGFNDYTKSGLTGGIETHPDWDPNNPDSRRFVNPICVWLGEDTDNNIVDESLFPKRTTVTDQVCDEGTDNIIIVD